MNENPSYCLGDPNRPVDSVSWNDVQQFIQKLNSLEDNTIYRLPTEAEWEFAARGGTMTVYSFGDDPNLLGEYAWHDQNSNQMTHPVGQLKPNAWDLYDMHGNVWEWVQDWHGGYSSEPVTDPQGPPTGSNRVARGGSWNSNAESCRKSSPCFASTAGSSQTLGGGPPGIPIGGPRGPRPPCRT